MNTPTQETNCVSTNTPNTAKSGKLKVLFEHFSGAVTRAAGKPIAFILAFFAVIIWACTGPIFYFSETWQLVINTGTTIITFLMVFLIQQAQNKDTAALHLKLNELIAASKGASNRLINAEDLNEDELVNLKNFFINISSHGMSDKELYKQHSVDEEKLKKTAEDIAEQLDEKVDDRQENKHKK